MEAFEFFNVFNVIILIVGAFAATFLLLTATSFIKISVVLFIVRNALGIQQTPPNTVIYSITLVMTAYIMAPVFTGIWNAFLQMGGELNSADDYIFLYTSVSDVILGFIKPNTKPEDIMFFQSTIDVLWRDQNVDIDRESLFVLLPAFMTSELTRAFEIGVLLYIPFIVIDFAVSAVLVAIGMQMMSPPIISVPIKLVLFVVIDGWGKLVQGLILSYTLNGS